MVIFEPLSVSTTQASAPARSPLNSSVLEPTRRVSTPGGIFDRMQRGPLSVLEVDTESSPNLADGERELLVEVEREIGELFDAQNGVRMIMTEDGPITFEAWCEQDDRDQEAARHDAMIDDVARVCRELNLPHLIFIQLAGDSWQEKVKAYNEYRSMIHAKCGLDPLAEYRKPKWARAPYLPHVEIGRAHV